MQHIDTPKILCPTCRGAGKRNATKPCTSCQGTGRVSPEVFKKTYCEGRDVTSSTTLMLLFLTLFTSFLYALSHLNIK